VGEAAGERPLILLDSVLVDALTRRRRSAAAVRAAIAGSYANMRDFSDIPELRLFDAS
jgi:hypothetical protein